MFVAVQQHRHRTLSQTRKKVSREKKKAIFLLYEHWLLHPATEWMQPWCTRARARSKAKRQEAYVLYESTCEEKKKYVGYIRQSEPTSGLARFQLSEISPSCYLSLFLSFSISRFLSVYSEIGRKYEKGKNKPRSFFSAYGSPDVTQPTFALCHVPSRWRAEFQNYMRLAYWKSTSAPTPFPPAHLIIWMSTRRCGFVVIFIISRSNEKYFGETKIKWLYHQCCY